VAGLCARVIVMYSGKIVETACADDLYEHPAHPYSAALLNSTPRLDVVMPRLVSIDGAPPDLVNPPVGCPFAARCGLAVTECLERMPPLEHHGPTRRVACWRPYEVPRG
jgi:oligopeptide transport system ATP-binding protein